MEITNETLPGVMLTVAGVCVSVIAGVLFVAFGPPVDVVNFPQRISPPAVLLVGIIISVGGILFVSRFSTRSDGIDTVKRNSENSPPPPYSDRHLRQSIVGEMLLHSPYTQIRLHSDKFLQIQQQHSLIGVQEQSEDSVDSQPQPQTEETPCSTAEPIVVPEQASQSSENKNDDQNKQNITDNQNMQCTIYIEDQHRSIVFEPDSLRDSASDSPHDETKDVKIHLLDSNKDNCH